MFIIINFRKYLYGIIIGALAGLILYFAQPVQWQGQALVGVGKILSTKEPLAIESLPTVVERIRSYSFIQKVAKNAGNNEIVSMLDPARSSALSVTPIRGGFSVIINVKGNSKYLVRSSLDSIVTVLLSEHKKLYDSYIVPIKKEISFINSDIAKQSIILDNLSHSNVKHGNGYYEYLASISSSLNKKQDILSKLKRSISGNSISKTYLLEPVSVNKSMLFFSMWRACLFGSSLGFLIGLIVLKNKRH